ncbi:hypothetical protein [Wuhan insect virus 8]|uniref:hypothetical protein n=1 Tax=Wuhan insect virus 8 TaxID=1923739 RepID=UPI00090B5804|nr:hypothetical protein [Wuhan insect virus 8]APG77764.1 hypothetical protein [Wuhan insect virus 8]
MSSSYFITLFSLILLSLYLCKNFQNVSSSQLLSTFYNSSFWNKLGRSASISNHPINEYLSAKARLDLLGTYSSSVFSFDRECISVVKTNALLEVDCQLPSRCGTLHHKLLSKTFYGQEVRVCYSFHHSVYADAINLYTIKFPRDLHYGMLTQHDSVDVHDIVPVDFFEHIVIANATDGYHLFPQICLQQYTSYSDDLPPSVVFKESDDTLCVSHTSLANVDCRPLFFPSVAAIVTTFDFPIAFKYNPYNYLLHLKFRNQDPDVFGYAADTTRGYFPISFINNLNYVSRSPLSSHFLDRNGSSTVFSRNYIYFDSRVHSFSSKDYCYRIESLYKNPISVLASTLISVVSPIFYELLELLEIEVENIIRLIVKAFLFFLKLVVELLSLIITPNVLSALMCAFSIYIYCFDFVITFVSFLIFLAFFLSY